MKDHEGKQKFRTLWLLALCVLSLPHANVEPERGFSINKSLLNIHGYSTKEETIEAVRLVKDFIIQRGGIDKVKVTKEMMKSCEKARARYVAFLEQKKKLEEQIKVDREKQEAVKKAKDAVSDIDNDISFVKRGIEVAEKSIEEGNLELGVVMKRKSLNRDKLVCCQSKIDMGLKRKAELQDDLKKLEEKKKKLL